jgi:hypothetical protein
MTMNLANPNTQLRQYASIHSAPKPVSNVPSRLNAPMIDRVHKTRPGCSACGKKVAWRNDWRNDLKERLEGTTWRNLKKRIIILYLLIL